MRCPYCGAPDTKVIDSRLSPEGDQVRRRRRCGICCERFNTYESIALEMPRVVKRDGTRVPFDQQKLLAGILRASEKRLISADVIEAMVARIGRRLLALGTNEITTREVGECALDELRDIDPVAYVRFASVYRKFDDIMAFKEEIERLQHLPSPEARQAQLDLFVGLDLCN
ncbi:transcriptional regulator NrdR [Thiospirillum jenense]|uniref:Transcriptional repressor NrdR n=1 Tax=Thiospirillum jenense TaxID=1653858 RepID=A0A839HCF1_9GAMM|nr:transcriptional regulator NrdR [Thiospirillum jenense]MBB1126214.1 transcriptional repressor NrdR [Thiospirillum jenense]